MVHYSWAKMSIELPVHLFGKNLHWILVVCLTGLKTKWPQNINSCIPLLRKVHIADWLSMIIYFHNSPTLPCGWWLIICQKPPVVQAFAVSVTLRIHHHEKNNWQSMNEQNSTLPPHYQTPIRAGKKSQSADNGHAKFAHLQQNPNCSQILYTSRTC